MKRFIILICLILLAVPTFANDDVNMKPEIKERYNRDAKYCNKVRKILEDNYYKQRTVTNKYNVTTIYNDNQENRDKEINNPYSEIKNCLKIKNSFPYDMPILNSNMSYYDANQKFENIIKSRRIEYLISRYGTKKYVEYNNYGQITKLDNKKVIYNEDGSLYKIGFFKVKYDKESNRYWNGLTEIKLNSFNEITYIMPLDYKYNSVFKVYDTLELYEYYQKMQADQFFSKYKYYGPRYGLYTSFFLLNVEGKPEVINAKKEYDLKFAKFFRIYLDYIYAPMNYDKLSEQEKLWFLSQVIETQNWMKTHKVGYKNPYEENFKKQMRTVVRQSNKTHIETEEERLRKEVNKLNKQINEQQQELNTLKDRQNERIYSIGGERVQYDSSGRIYSIGGKRVQY